MHSSRDEPYIVLSWRNESLVSEDSEPDDFVYETSGELFHIDEDDEREVVGRFVICYVDVDRAVNTHTAISDVMDAHSHTTAEYAEAIFASDAGDFSEEVLDLVDYSVGGSNVLILDRLEILPRYRGKRCGLRTIRHMINRFSAGTGLVAIKPFPLQFEVEPSDPQEQAWRARLELDRLPRNEARAVRKLREYYGMLGFRNIRGTPFMVRSTAYPLPSLEEE